MLNRARSILEKKIHIKLNIKSIIYNIILVVRYTYKLYLIRKKGTFNLMKMLKQ